MKKNHILSLIFITIVFLSCATNKSNGKIPYSYSDEDYSETTEIITHQPSVTDDFLGDFSPILMEDLMFLSKTKNTVKPKQINKVYLIPKKNSVELTFRDSVNEVTIELNKTERNKIIETCNLFLNQYEEKTLPHHKVSSKTAYLKSKCTVWFGVLSPTIMCSRNDYFLNCEFIEKRPYLLLKFIPTQCDERSDFTPKISLYMSPTQVRAFIDQMDQETLNAYVQELNEKAYTY